MTMMKAAYLTKRPELKQTPEILQVGEIPAPDPDKLKKDEVIVDVKAASVNVDDMHMQEGSFCGGIFFLQAPIQTEEKPRIVGCDFAGIVKAVGDNASKSFKVGDSVCGINFQPSGQQGTWAEQVLTAKDSIIHVPKSPTLTYAEWCSLAMPAFVANAMFKEGAIIDAKNDEKKKNDNNNKDSDTEQQQELRCLVVGASGGIGSYLVQLLSSQPHVSVTGVCSTKNVEFVRDELGADEVFDYTKGTLTEHLERSSEPQRKFDCVFDLVGGSDLEEEAYGSLLVDGRQGRFVTAVGPSKYVGATIMSAWDQLKYFNHTFIWPFVHNLLHRDKPSYHMAAPFAMSGDMFDHVGEAKIKPVIEKLVPFERDSIAEAVKLVQSHRAKGRVVLAIDPDCTKSVLIDGEEQS